MKMNFTTKTTLFLGLSALIGSWGSDNAHASFFDDEVDATEAVSAALKCQDELSEFAEYNLTSVDGKTKKERNNVQTKIYTMSFSEGGYFGGPPSKKVGDVEISVKVTPPVRERPGSRQTLKWSCKVKNSATSGSNYPAKKTISGQLIQKIVSVGTRSEKKSAVLVLHENNEEIMLRGKDGTNAFEISDSLKKLFDKDVTCEGFMVNKSEMIQAVCEED